MSKISIIIPVYNVEKYLKRCMDSILNQTFQDFEIVLINDGSTDKSGVLCDEYAKADKRIHVFHQANMGRAKARNVGLDYVMDTDSEWITMIDSDDWVHERYLEILYNVATDNNVAVSACEWERDLNEWGDTFIEEKGEVYSPEELWVKGWKTKVNPPCKLFKKELWKNIRFPEGRIYEDGATMPRAIFLVDRMAFVPLKLYFYFYNENGTMAAKWSERKLQEILTLKELLVFFKKIKKKRVRECIYKSLIYCYYRNILQAQEAQVNNENDKIIKKLRKGLRKCLRGKPWRMPIRHYAQFYCEAWPHRKKLIHFFKRVDGKLARLFKWDV